MAYVCQFGVNSFPSEPMMKNLVSARRSLGLYQHHDGITGTAKDFVVVDCGKKLLKAIMDLKRMIVECAYLLMVSDRKSYSYQELMSVFNIDEYRMSHDSMPEKIVLRLSNQPQCLS
ncbi:alpha-mannosidase 2-like [Liolophura sinensis]|uniref:alpha-mannosidase 2-like n=1 Tax=Liolophura sinensis TaxID=3198878 RepID=UPI003158C6BD